VLGIVVSLIGACILSLSDKLDCFGKKKNEEAGSEFKDLKQ